MIRRLALVAAILIALACTIALVPSKTRLLVDPEDLRAFYCAGEAVREHRDPYLAEPIRTCENREIRAAGLSPYPALAVPAPLPAYALVPFALLSTIDFPRASTIYAFLLVTAIGLTAILISKTSRARPIVTIAALSISDGLIAMLNGQIFSFALLALCAGAWELSRGNHVRAALFTACAAIEPHVALPAILGLAYAVPRARATLAIVLAALGIVALLAVGLDTNLEYITRVLPAHARSEATAIGQFSLTSVLYHLGFARGPAILIGNVQFAAMCALGVVTGTKLARRYDAPELAMLVPAAFATLGGPFIHLTQMATALPALFACAYRIPERRNVFGASIVLLAIPWQDIIVNPIAPMLATIAAIVGIIAAYYWRGEPRRAVGALVLAVALGAGLCELRIHHPLEKTNAGAAMAAVRGDTELAEATWERFIEITQQGSVLDFTLTRAPTWLATLSFAIVAIRLARRPASA